MKLDSILSTVTVAALVGLLVLNAGNAVQLIDALSKATTNYISAIQGGGQ